MSTLDKHAHELHGELVRVIDEHMEKYDDPADVVAALEILFGTVMAQLLIPPAASMPLILETAEMTFEVLKKGASLDTWPRPATLDCYFDSVKASPDSNLEKAWEEMFSDEPVLVIEFEDGDLDDGDDAKKTPDMVN